MAEPEKLNPAPDAPPVAPPTAPVEPELKVEKAKDVDAHILEMGMKIDTKEEALKTRTKLTELKHTLLAKIALIDQMTTAKTPEDEDKKKEWQEALKRLNDFNDTAVNRRINLADNPVDQKLRATGMDLKLNSTMARISGVVGTIGSGLAVAYEYAIKPLINAITGALNRLGGGARAKFAGLLRAMGKTNAADSLENMTPGAKALRERLPQLQTLMPSGSKLELNDPAEDAKALKAIELAQQELFTKYPLLRQRYENFDLFVSTAVKNLPAGQTEYTFSQLADAVKRMVNDTQARQAEVAEATRLAMTPDARIRQELADKVRGTWLGGSGTVRADGDRFTATRNGATVDLILPVSIATHVDPANGNATSADARLFREALTQMFNAKKFSVGGTTSWEIRRLDSTSAEAILSPQLAASTLKPLDNIAPAFLKQNRANALRMDSSIPQGKPTLKLVTENGQTFLACNGSTDLTTLPAFFNSSDQMNQLSSANAGQSWTFEAGSWKSA